MVHRLPIFENPVAFLTKFQPDTPVHFFAPRKLEEKAGEFLRGFPGLVTFAVKSNPAPAVLTHLLQSGIRGFDVASPSEIQSVKDLCPNCALHYNNPVRSHSEIKVAAKSGVTSYSVDTIGELEKLARLVNPTDTETSVRFKLDIEGAAYDFGSKFGACPSEAIDLLRRAEEYGFVTSLTFHPGTQCKDPAAYAKYILAAQEISQGAGVSIRRLNVGGGFPSGRDGNPTDLSAFFSSISDATMSFEQQPDLVCEPGRGMVGDAFSLAVRVKSVRPNAVFLNDGIYGGLSECPSMGVPKFCVVSPEGRIKENSPQDMIVFGPTCDSIDTLTNPIALPHDIAEGDYLIFRSMGAYVTGVSTMFNGYGARETVLVRDL